MLINQSVDFVGFARRVDDDQLSTKCPAEMMCIKPARPVADQVQFTFDLSVVHDGKYEYT